jgi:hypothetical protein
MVTPFLSDREIMTLFEHPCLQEASDADLKERRPLQPDRRIQIFFRFA